MATQPIPRAIRELLTLVLLHVLTLALLNELRMTKHQVADVFTYPPHSIQVYVSMSYNVL